MPLFYHLFIYLLIDWFLVFRFGLKIDGRNTDRKTNNKIKTKRRRNPTIQLQVTQVKSAKLALSLLHPHWVRKWPTFMLHPLKVPTIKQSTFPHHPQISHQYGALSRTHLHMIYHETLHPFSALVRVEAEVVGVAPHITKAVLYIHTLPTTCHMDVTSTHNTVCLSNRRLAVAIVTIIQMT